MSRHETQPLGYCRQPTKEVEMAVISARRRAVTALIAVAGLALLASVATSAQAQGQTRENLQAHGWTCVEFAPANRWSCFDPGVGPPFPGNPDP